MSLSTRRPRARARLTAVALAVVGVVGLSGCGGSGAGAAAVLDDSRVTTSDLQTATSQIDEATGQQGGVPSSAVLGWLALAPYVLPAAAERKAVASQDDACRLLASLAGQAQGETSTSGSDQANRTPVDCARDPYAEPTLRAVRTFLSVGRSLQTMTSIDEVNQWWDKILDRAESDGIEISPRYGEFRRTSATDQATDLNQVTGQLLSVVGPATPDWLETTQPTTEPSPTP